MSKNNNDKSNKILWAFIWIAVGVLWMLSNYGKLPFSFTLEKDWPVIFIIIGVISFYNIFTKHSRKSRKNICIVTSKKDTEDKKHQILDAVEKNEISAEEAAEKLKDI
jgi:choline-glycine betaine transporter